MSKYENINVISKNDLCKLLIKCPTYSSALRELGHEGKNMYAIKLLQRKIREFDIQFVSTKHKRPRKSWIWTIEKDILQSYYDESSTKKEVLAKLGYRHNRYYEILSSRTIKSNIDLTKFNHNSSIHKKNSVQYELKDVMVEVSSYSRNSLKKDLLRKWF